MKNMKRIVLITTVLFAALSLTSCHKNHEPEKPKEAKFDHIELVAEYTYSQDILDLFQVEVKVSMNGTDIASEKISKTSGKVEVKDKNSNGTLECKVVVTPNTDKFVAGKVYNFSNSFGITVESVNDDGTKNGLAHESHSSTAKDASFNEEDRSQFIDVFTRGISKNYSYTVTNKGGKISIE